MDKAHQISEACIRGVILHLCVDGEHYQIDIASVSQRFRDATQEQRERFEISPAAYGIHWPDLDEDLSIDGLISVMHAPAAAQDYTL